jgi:cell wall-associated NlpC family hydrolase
MSDLAAVQARVAQLQATLGVRPRPAAPAAGAGFAAALASALDPAASPAAASAGTGTPATPARSGGDAVALARSFTGVPYRWGGNDPATGLDCSGLTQLVYRKLGVELPRVAADQARQGTAVASLAAARPGDLVFFGTPAHHVGIYAGDGKMIDAPRAGKTVGLHNLWGTPSAIRRVLPTSEPTSGQAPAAGGQLANVPFGRLFAQAGAKHGVDPALLAAVAKAESGFNPRAVSHAGARGLMQLMPSTAAGLGVDDAFDPPQAVDGSARLLRSLLTRFGGRVDLALAGYNAGPGAVQRYGGVPPYAETRAYVSRVNDYWEALR